MMDQACGNCLCWIREDGDVGRCRRRAPMPAAVLAGPHAARWPVTREGEWCAEHIGDAPPAILGPDQAPIAKDRA